MKLEIKTGEKVLSVFGVGDMVWRVLYRLERPEPDVSICGTCGHKEVTLQPVLKVWQAVECEIENWKISGDDLDSVTYIFNVDYDGDEDWSWGSDIFETQEEAEAEAARRNGKETKTIKTGG